MADGTYYITHHLDQRLLELKQEYATASDERKKEIAFEAQAIRDSGTEGIDWSVSANKSLDYYIIDTDITDKLNGLMDEVGSKHFYKRFARIPLTVELMRYLDFANMVRPGGIYDLKAQAEWQGKEHYIYNGNIVWFDAPGNILYGYLGKSMGFSDLVLYAAPGVAQIAVGTSSWNFAFSFFDDPRDQENIRLGIQIFRETHSVIWW